MRTVKERVSPDCTAPVHLHLILLHTSPISTPPRTALCYQTPSTNHLVLQTSHATPCIQYIRYLGIACTVTAPGAFRDQPIVDPGISYSNNTFGCIIPPASLIISPFVSVARLSCHSHPRCDEHVAQPCLTTHGASRSRCRRSASTSQEQRAHPRAHRLRQAMPTTRRRRSNAHTRTRRPRSHRRHGP